jgi:hypothetical protein
MTLTSAECTAKASHALTQASAAADVAMRDYWLTTAASWTNLAGAALVQEMLERMLDDGSALSGRHRAA